MKIVSAAKLVFFIFHIRGSRSETCNSKFQISNTCMPMYGSVINAFNNTASISGCSSLCNQDIRCNSVIFDTTSGKCMTNSETTSIFPTGCLSMVKYAEVTNSCHPSVGMACTPSSQCKTKNATCITGFCGCIPGYSYRASDDNCVDMCSSYGSTFQTALEYRLFGYNNRFIVGSSIAACKAACVAETDFTCRTAEFSASACHLSVDTALTQPSAYQSIAGFIIYQRDCA